MKLSRGVCKIVGLRVGEMELNSLNPEYPTMSVKFVLLQAEGEGSGQYEKKLGWSEETIQALQKFVEAAEKDALSDLFEHTEETHHSAEKQEDSDDLPWPTLGGDEDPPQV